MSSRSSVNSKSRDFLLAETHMSIGMYHVNALKPRIRPTPAIWPYNLNTEMAAFLYRSEVLKSLFYYTMRHAPLKPNLNVFKQTFPIFTIAWKGMLPGFGVQRLCTWGSREIRNQRMSPQERANRQHTPSDAGPSRGPCCSLTPLREANTRHTVGIEPRLEFWVLEL